MRFAAAMLAAALGACASEDVAPQLEHRFTMRPVRLVASEALPTECLESLTTAVLWYRDHGATLSLEVASVAERVLNGIVVGGEAGFVPGKLNPGVRGSTRIALTPGGDVFGAEVTLAECDALSVAHECGHVMGLVHVDAKNLMHRAIDHGAWLLNDTQVKWVADDPYSVWTSFAQGKELRWEDAPDVVTVECQ